MQLSLHADYSCRTLMFLALLPPEKKSSIEEIAQAYAISTNHLVKVVHKLGKLGYIETSRGRSGGIRLARPAQDINIGELIRRTEPNFVLLECFDQSTSTCPITRSCKLNAWLAKALEAFLSVLDEITLADIVYNKKKLSEVLSLATP